MAKNNEKILIIIQARADSRRFPKKVLARIKGKPVLWHVINRVKQMKYDEIVVATTNRKIDNKIVEIAEKSNVECFRGRTNDVLDRFFQAAKNHKADIIVRITADCPLIDPVESNKTIDRLLAGKYDYVTTDDKTYPKGLDTECFNFRSLKKAWKNAKLKSEREHVTPYIWKNPDKFKITKVRNDKRIPQRWVVDYKDDLVFVKKIYERLYKNEGTFLMIDILRVIRKEPQLLRLNQHHNPNEGYSLSLKND
jgi:spore coat polysaccharide biosynthesis protein SpsF